MFVYTVFYAYIRQLANAQNYEDRSAIRKALRKLKGKASKKQVGTANYRRAGYQTPKSMIIPNSVTGNVLPDKVNMADIRKVDAPQAKSATSYLKSGTKDTPYGEQRRRSSGQAGGVESHSSSPRGSVSSHTSITPEPKEMARPAEVCAMGDVLDNMNKQDNKCLLVVQTRLCVLCK